MTDKAIVEAMARLDGYLNLKPTCGDVEGSYMVEYKDGNARYWTRCPAYLTSHDAVQRVVDGLVDGQDNGGHSLYMAYRSELARACLPVGVLILKATPRQKCEAILKAKGVWE